MEQLTRFTYIGPASHTDGLTDELKTRGLKPTSARSEETRDFSTVLDLVVVAFAVTGPLSDILAAVRAFKARTPGARIEGLPVDEPRSVVDRLRQLDEMHALGTITSEEYKEQRRRLLGEL